uniref:DNA ligase 1 n=1 Tax=Noccaea caerulescens TaxID=107243 RepID=A0A1J3F4I4_NOCCA
MSRCFPFPPPGYEKKIRTDEADSLIKEKQKKEKKHKKEKKDKEKKEGKEKKDKETSKDKHKERKEKKDKKDKDRNKEKSRTSADKIVAGVLPSTASSRDRENIVPESKFIEDLTRRIRDEEKATESQSSGKIGRPNDEKRINTARNYSVAKRSEDEVVRVPSCTAQKGAEVMCKPVERNDHAKENEFQEKNHRRDNVTKSDKQLRNEEIKKCEPKTIRDRCSKEKTEVINKTGQEKPKFVEGGPRLEEGEHDTVDTRNFRVHDLSRASVKNRSSEGILGKRMDLETNGLLYENGSEPNKVQRPVASPISSVENGRKLGACQTPPKPVSEMQGTVCNREVKEHKINGFVDSQESKSRPPVSSVKVRENGEASAKKRPHSDLKYLDQILTVPKREELHEVDDDEKEWLFGQSGVRLLKKQRADSSTSLDETLQVWNKAFRIESADIVALPYVVPF